MIYTVGEAAEMLGVAPSALRYYDKEGLLPFVERSSGGMRMFKESDIEWLKLIGCLKATGMPIKGIKRFIDCTLRGDESIGERLEILNEQRKNVVKQIKELEEHLEMIDYKVWYYTKAKEAGTTAVLAELSDSEVPEKFLKFRKKS